MISAWKPLLIGVVANVVTYIALKIARHIPGRWIHVLHPESVLLQLLVLIGLFATTFALVTGFSESTYISIPTQITSLGSLPFEDLRVDRSLKVIALRWGQGEALREINPTGDHQINPELGLPKEWSEDQKRFELRLKELLGSIGERLYVPERVYLDVRRPKKGDFYVYVCTNQCYLQQRVSSGNVWTYRCHIGKPGIADFVDLRSGTLIKNDDRFAIGDGIGTVAVVVVVHKIGKYLVSRSPFLVVIRKGIRDPDDVWLVEDRLVGWNVIPGQIIDCRIVFQSWEMYGHDYDLFTCQPDGSDQRCLTNQFRDCYDGLLPDLHSAPPAHWVAPDRIRFYSNRSADRQRRLYEIRDRLGSKAILVE